MRWTAVQACTAGNPATYSIVPGRMEKGSWVLTLGSGPHPRLVTQSRMPQEAAFVEGLDRKLS